ncbi:MAG: exo-alpha-sialidase [Actinobacteria bacterium]|nr:MAG: exo-alpha-sialidase [Actinomycetota bacterium]
MKGRVRLLLGPVLVPILVAVYSFAGQPQTASPGPFIKNNVLRLELARDLGKASRPKWAQPVSSGVMYNLLLASGALEARAKGTQAPGWGAGAGLGTAGCRRTFTGFVSNTRVNQDCGLRRQAEESIAVNPLHPKNLIAGQNDSRVGFNQCGIDFSFDGGVTWGDMLPPFKQVIFPNGHVGDFCSDPTVTFDSQGNAYFGGLSLSLDGLDSAILVAKSNAPIGGAFYHSPLMQPFQIYRDVPMGVAALDENPNIANDKELMVGDSNPDSPKADNLYMVWTRFNADTGQGVGADSPIFFSQSTDGGATWSTGIEISGSNAKACTVFSGEKDPNACDQDQGGHVIVGHDGTVYVGFGNGNTPENGINQHMIVSCPPSADCSQVSAWSGPVKITDDYGTQSVGPDSQTGCPSGRQCLPPNGYRVYDFVWGSLSIDNSGVLYFVFSDYRNGQDSKNCPGLGPAAKATPPCNNDVFYSYSTDGGTTWTDPFNVTAGRPFGETAQWQPWGAVTPNGRTLYVAFYDRHYGNCEFTGCNDITLTAVRNAATASPKLSNQRLTTSSMPNLVVANNPLQAGFLGDYMWLAAPFNKAPYVVWADTRGRHGSVEEDIYFAR